MDQAAPIAIGIGLLGVSWLCWTGRWRGWSRVAVGPSVPITLLPAVGICLVAIGIGNLTSGAIRGVAYALAFLAPAAGAVLLLWQPDWWGPRWFRERDRTFDLSVPINAAVASTVRTDLGEAASEAVVRRRLGNEPTTRWLAYLVNDEYGRPSAVQRTGMVRGHLMLYPEAIAFAAEAREDRMRGAAVVQIVPAADLLGAQRVPAGTRPDAATRPAPDLGARWVPRIRLDTLDGPLIFETVGAGRKVRQIERLYLRGRQPAAAL